MVVRRLGLGLFGHQPFESSAIYVQCTVKNIYMTNMSVTLNCLVEVFFIPVFNASRNHTSIFIVYSVQTFRAFPYPFCIFTFQYISTFIGKHIFSITGVVSSTALHIHAFHVTMRIDNIVAGMFNNRRITTEKRIYPLI